MTYDFNRTALRGTLHDRFEGMFILRKGDVKYSPRSCNLIPLDLLEGSFLKSQVYAYYLPNLSVLKVNIIHTIGQIRSNL